MYFKKSIIDHISISRTYSYLLLTFVLCMNTAVYVLVVQCRYGAAVYTPVDLDLNLSAPVNSSKTDLPLSCINKI